MTGKGASSGRKRKSNPAKSGMQSVAMLEKSASNGKTSKLSTDADQVGSRITQKTKKTKKSTKGTEPSAIQRAIEKICDDESD